MPLTPLYSWLSKHCPIDFLCHWAGVQLLWSGGNPYDAQQHHAMVQTSGIPFTFVPATPFLPPWGLVLLSPVLWFGFPIALLLWTALQLGAAVFILRAVSSMYRPREVPDRILLTGCAFAIFPPLKDAIHSGHLGLLLAAAVMGALWATVRGRLVLAGCCAVLFSLKAHIVYLPALLLMLWWLRRRELKPLIAAALLFVAATAVAVAVSPRIFTLHSELVLASGPTYKTPTITAIIRQALATTDRPYPPLWPAVVITGTTIACCLMWWLRQSATTAALRWLMPPTTCISLITGPYAWLHDMVICAPAYLQLAYLVQLPRLPLGDRLEVALELFLPALIALCLPLLFEATQVHNIWFVPLLLLVSLRWRGMLRATFPEQI